MTMNAERRDEPGRRDQARTDLDGLVWVDGVLHLRATTRRLDEHGAERTVLRSDVDDDAEGTTCRLLVRERTAGTMRRLDTSSTAELVPLPGDDRRVTVRVRSEARFDPRADAPGTGPTTGPGTWDVLAEPLGPGSEHPIEVRGDQPARPALVDGVPYVASRDEDGTLRLEVAQVRPLVDAARPRAAAARVGTAADDAGRRTVRISVPLDGIRVFPTDAGHAVADGGAELVAPDGSRARRALRTLRRRDRASTAPGAFEVVTEGEAVTLQATVAATPGLWQVVLAPGGTRTPVPLLVRVGRGGAARVVAPPRAARQAAAADLAAAPRVSVVVPVYNGANTVEEAVRSVFDQTLPAEQVEIVTVDDGSTDDSLAVLRRLEKQHPRMRVVTQARSGTAAAPRNAGIEASTGRHLFFLDADDVLAPAALEKMADAADALEADVVLGKMEGFAGRTNVPRRVFKKTSVDADLVANHMMGALGPTKLFRAAHVSGQGLRFPAGLLHGEDQPFVAEAELSARRVVILTDAVYYRVRGHEARRGRRSGSVIDVRLRKTRLLTGVVERYTEPGDRRDELLRRSFGDRALEGAFRRAYLALDAEARADLVDRVADEFGHLWTPGLRARVEPHTRPVYDLVFRRDPVTLAALVEHAGGDPRHLLVVARRDGFFVDAPASVEDALGREALRADPPEVAHLLTGLTVSGDRVTARGQVHPLTAAPLPTGVHAEWRLRRASPPTGTESVEARTAVRGTTPVDARQDAVTFEIGTDVDELPGSGVWDLWITPLWDDRPGTPVRFGAVRDRSVDKDAVALEASGAVLFGAARSGNLSIDRDGSGHPAPDARMTALRLDPDGRPEAVLHVASDAPPRVYAYVATAEGRDARHRLPWSRVDDEHVAARLPVPFTASTLPLTLAVSQHGVLAAVVGEGPARAGSDELRAEAVPGEPARPGARAAAVVRVTRTSSARAPEVPAAGPTPGGATHEPVRLWWWRWRHPTELNFGDEVTAPLVERLTGRRVVWTPLDRAEIVGAGSVLQMALRERGEDMPAVWGAGMIRPFKGEAPAGFVPRAVRGRLSLEGLSPEAQAGAALGDPGLLADRLVDGPVGKRYALGVIPHYRDVEDPTMRAIAALPGVRRIDVAWTPEEVAREIAACEVVVSSSMHGLIFADALGVPNARLKVSDKLVGGDHKFRDYCSAFGPDRYQPPLTPDDVRDLDLPRLVELVTGRFRPPTGIDDLKRGLVASLPV
ncbi:hypothetical protein GCM10009809_03380 [Isoptericola hypogeus]|uniref:Glycosyltransferase n=1 Tax=Isoptericola hypogeus TaxID=300179 RepID=A0ABN2IS51_9MICO